MNRRLTVLALGFSAACIGAVVGCANGTDEVDPSVADFANEPSPDAGNTPPSEGVKLPPPSNPPTPSDDGDAGASTDPDAGAADGGTPDGGSTGVSCNATNACNTATDLGSVSGDTGSDSKTASGTTSQWLKVRVTEDDNGIFGVPLKMKATLTSPPGTNFDLFLYVPSTDTVECSAVSEQSTSLSSSDTASTKFGEDGTFSNGNTDDRTITVEVRHVSGPCDPSKKWTLTVGGNQ